MLNRPDGSYTRIGVKRALRALLLCALLFCALRAPASAVWYEGDQLKGRMQECANALNAAGFGGGYYTNGTIRDGTGTNVYIEFKNTQNYTEGNNLQVILFYTVGSSKELLATSRITDLQNRCASTLDKEKKNVFKPGTVDAFCANLPDNAQVVGISVNKDKKSRWGAEWMRVAAFSQDIMNDFANKTTLVDASDGRHRQIPGAQWVAGSSDARLQSELSGNDDKVTWFMLGPAAGGYAQYSMCMYEFVTGENGYANREGTITLNYTDYQNVTYNVPITIADGYEALHPGSQINGIGSSSDFDITDWSAINVRDMQAASATLTHNLYQYDTVSDTAFLPYTATHLLIILPQNIKQINSIRMDLDDKSATLTLQGVRLVELSRYGGTDRNFWNGSYSLERLSDWDGRLLAEVTKAHTFQDNIVFSVGAASELYKLTAYAPGAGPALSSSGQMVGVSIQFADVLNAGVEELLAKNALNALNLWANLDPYVEECFTLELQYMDIRGARRIVTVPVLTTYIVQLAMQDAISASSGISQGQRNGRQVFENLSSTNPEKTDWISGIMQQNENIGLSLRLSEFAELEELHFRYGSKPYGLTYTQTTHDGGCDGDYVTSDVRTIDPAKDVIAIENICFYTGVTSDNFTNSYDVSRLAVKFTTALSPQYCYTAPSKNGVRLAKNGAFNLTAGSGSFVPGSVGARNYTDRYLVKIKTADIETAGTANPVNFSIGYTTTSGAQRSTGTASMVTASANFFGYDYYGEPESQQYEMHMRRNCLNEFTVDIPNVQSIDSITLTLVGSNEWQIEYIDIGKLNSLEQRRTDGQGRRADGSIYWKRDYDMTRVAYARKSVLLQQSNATRTIFFTTYDEQGNATAPEQTSKNESYITTLPDTLTYDEALRDLGLSVAKYTYQVNVTVADVPDAGSSNYFYFQLAFENGTSSVVLANQQLASDSFRQGMVESFQIKTTQNYGNVVSVRIICDNATSTSNVFDKLNIEQISVTLAGTKGASRSWIVDRVGWIDITYQDEGQDEVISGIGAENGAERAQENVNIIKDFEVNRTATAVDLLFALATGKESTSDLIGALPRDESGNISLNATLVYFDSEGIEKTYAFDLIDAIKTYNETDKTSWLFRPNHFDRFILSMTDVNSIQALYLTLPSGVGISTPWLIEAVSVQQVSGMGEVYLSSVFNSGEFYRECDSAVDLAQSNNETPVSASPGETAALAFTENQIDVSGSQDLTTWSTAITSTPNSKNDVLNLYIFPGYELGALSNFNDRTPAIRATVNYSTVYGGRPVSTAFDITARTTLSDGRTVLYEKNLSVSAMATLNSIKLSSLAASGSQPYIGSVIAERVRDGVMLDVYYIDFGSFYLGNGNPEYAPKTGAKVSPMHQTAQLQPALDKSWSLTAHDSDILVALRYTSALDPDGNTVYRSPYVYLTDAGYSTVSYGKAVIVPFSVNNVGKVVGLSVISTGPTTVFERAMVANYGGEPGNDSVLLDSCGVLQQFTTSAVRTDLVSDGSAAVPASFTFTTGAEETYAGAGTVSAVHMDVGYINRSGAAQSVTVADIAKYLTEGESFAAGSTQTISLLMPDAGYLTDVTLSSEDDWFLASLTASLSPLTSDDVYGPSSSVKSVNNHAAKDAPLTLDVTPVSYGGTADGNSISAFSVTASSSNAQKTASATAGQVMHIEAYVGDTVSLKPNVSAIGSPDTTWTWIGADASLSISQTDNSATFNVPYDAAVGNVYGAYSVRSNGNQQLSVPISIVIIEKPAPVPAPSSSLPEDGDTGGGNSGSSDTGGGDTGSGDTGGA